MDGVGRRGRVGLLTDDCAAFVINRRRREGPRLLLFGYSLGLAPRGHFDGEAVAAAGDGLDEGAAVVGLAERLAQREDVLRERRLADKGVGPNLLQQFF